MIVVFGSINLDLIFSVPGIPRPGETVLGDTTLIQPGGKGANQAVAAARDGGRVMMAGAVGNDQLAEAALRLMVAAGVDLTRVARVDASTGCASIAVDPSGENAIAVGSGANLFARADQVEDGVLGPSTTLLLQMEVPPLETATLIERAKTAGARILLNLAPASELPESALRDVDVLLVNETEATWLAGQMGCAVSAWALRQRLGSVAVVLTRGGEGAEIASGDEVWHQPAWKVDVVDTTAAGDCFAGVLAHRLDRGGTLRAAIGRASAAAALCCTRSGSQASLPLAAETEAFIQRSM